MSLVTYPIYVVATLVLFHVVSQIQGYLIKMAGCIKSNSCATFIPIQHNDFKNSVDVPFALHYQALRNIAT